MPNDKVPTNSRAEALAPKPKGGKSRKNKSFFRPRRGPIDPDEPTRQANPLGDALKNRREPLDLQDLQEAIKPQAKGLMPPTKPKNDPTDLEAFSCLGLQGFSTQIPIHELTTDDSGFMDLVDTVYEIYCASDKYFSRSVPRSFFVYYHSMLLWWKKLHVSRPTDRIRNILGEFERYMPTNPTIPKWVGIYLQGVDRYVDSNGIEWTPSYTLPDDDPINGISGFFGPLDEVTFGLYINQISPGVVATRILNDVFVTLGARGIETRFRLPFATDAGRNLTSNLAGYSNGVNLDRMCMSALEPYNIRSIRNADFVHTQARFGVNKSGFPFHSRILGYVSDKLAGTGLPVASAFNKRGTSSALLGWIEIPESEPGTRSTMSDMNLHSMSRQDATSWGVLSSFKYRVLRNPADINSSCVEVTPVMWMDNINIHMEIADLDVSNWVVRGVNGDQVVRQLCGLVK